MMVAMQVLKSMMHLVQTTTGGYCNLTAHLSWKWEWIKLWRDGFNVFLFLHCQWTAQNKQVQFPHNGLGDSEQEQLVFRQGKSVALLMNNLG